MVDINKIVDRAVKNTIHACNLSNLGNMQILEPGFKYIYAHKDTGKLWAAYCTYYTYDWDRTVIHKNIDLIFIISGTKGKLKYTVGSRSDRLYEYKNDRVKQGYVKFQGDIFETYPEIRDTLDKTFLWIELKR